MKSSIIDYLKNLQELLIKAITISDVVDVLDKIFNHYKENGVDEIQAIKYTIVFFDGICVGCEQAFYKNFYILEYRTILNMFGSRHGYGNLIDNIK